MDKKNKNPNVPNLRFKKYSNDWVKYKITDLGKMQRGKSKHRPRDDEKLYGGEYPFIQTGDIKKAHLYINEYEKTYSTYGLSQSKLWKKGTLCITIAANIAETAILGMDACFPDSIIGWCSNNQLTNNLFIKYYFDFYKEQLKRLSVGGAQENLNLDKLEKIYFNIPSLQEQNKIADFFYKIDEKIVTQIKIISDYKTLKKGINYFLIGRYTPNTFISECLKCNTSSLKESEIIDENLGMFPVYGANGIIKNINTYMMDSSSISIVKDGAGAGRLNYLSGKYSFIGTLNCFTIKKGYNLKYIYYALENINFNRYIVGSGIPHVYYNDFKQEKIYIPADTKEIDKIEKCLSSIDSVIELETKKLSKLTLQKKYLINNMFI